jgi:hypothetical protein
MTFSQADVPMGGKCRPLHVHLDTVEPIGERLGRQRVATTVTSDVDVLSRADARVAVRRTLADLGLTFEQLAEQARAGHFETIEARLAWLAIGELYRR